MRVIGADFVDFSLLVVAGKWKNHGCQTVRRIQMMDEAIRRDDGGHRAAHFYQSGSDIPEDITDTAHLSAADSVIFRCNL